MHQYCYMKQFILYMAAAACFCQCTPKKEYVTFENLKPTEFNAGQLKLPGGKIIDSIKRAHDSCMGVSFDANVILAGTKDSLFIGDIVNRQTLKRIITLGDLGIDLQKMGMQYNIVTNPCYEKKELHFPLRSILGENFSVTLPGAEDAVNKELNDIITAAQDEEMETGSWIYLDLNEMIKNIVDTNKTAIGLQYRKSLLDSSNMMLAAMESIMRVSFMIYSAKEMSEKLKTALSAKPLISLPGKRYPIKFFYIGPDQFQVSSDGFFPVIGKFMKAVIKR